MPNQRFTILDGIAPSFADIRVIATPSNAPLIEMEDIKSINTGMSMEIGEQRGASGGRVIYTTTGNVKNEASMTLYATGFNKFLRGLRPLAPLRGGKQRLISLVHFGLQVIWTPPGMTEIFEFRVKGCRYTGRAFNAAEGPDAQTIDVTLNPKEIADMIDGEECVLI